MNIRFFITCCLTVCAAFVLQHSRINAQDIWINPAGGFFDVASNWADGTEPFPNETALFNLPGAYSVNWDSFTGNVINQFAIIENGFVRFVSLGSGTGGTLLEYELAADVVIENGAQLQLGFINDAHKLVTGGTLVIDEGTFRMINGSQATLGGSISIGESGFATATISPARNAVGATTRLFGIV